MFKKSLLVAAVALTAQTADARYQKDASEHETNMLKGLSGLEGAVVKTATGSEVMYSAYDVNASMEMMTSTEWIPDFPYDSKEQWKTDYGYSSSKVINAIYQCQMKPGTVYVEGFKPGTMKKAYFIKKNIAALNISVCYQIAEWD